MGEHSHTGHDHAAGDNRKVACFLNVGVMLREIAGGRFINSNGTAILPNALHDTGDNLSPGAAWASQRQANRHDTATFIYGFPRRCTPGTLITGPVLGSIRDNGAKLRQCIREPLLPQLRPRRGMLRSARMAAA